MNFLHWTRGLIAVQTHIGNIAFISMHLLNFLSDFGSTLKSKQSHRVFLHRNCFFLKITYLLTGCFLTSLTVYLRFYLLGSCYLGWSTRYLDFLSIDCKIAKRICQWFHTFTATMFSAFCFGIAFLTLQWMIFRETCFSWGSSVIKPYFLWVPQTIIPNHDHFKSRMRSLVF